jgi:hypothetical protein
MFIGSVRRECTDHLIAFNATHLRRIPAKYAIYACFAREGRALHTPNPAVRRGCCASDPWQPTSLVRSILDFGSDRPARRRPKRFSAPTVAIGALRSCIETRTSFSAKTATPIESDNTPRNPEICLAFTNPRHRTISGRQEQGPSPVLRLTLPPFLLNRPAVFISAVDTTADTTWSRRRKEIRPRLRPGVFEPRVLRAGKQLAGLEEMVDLLEGFYPAESGAL